MKIKMPMSPCTNCGKMLDAASRPDTDDHPGPDDLTVCIYCHHLMAFADDMTLRDLTSDEMTEVAGNKRLIGMLKALEEMKKAARQ